jgi:hypothetical protein
MTRAEYETLRRARRALQTIPAPYHPALQLIDRVLSDAERAFKVEDVYQDEEERKVT